MRILIACEESQTVCKEFRKLGFETFSCDIMDCSGGHPEWHIKDDVLNHLNDGWDLMIAHPPCTHLACSGRRVFYLKIADGRQQEALNFVSILLNAPIDKIALENPIGVISTKIRKPDQIIQPYWFGDNVQKATCLWLKNLSKLIPTNIVEPEMTYYKNGQKVSKFHYETAFLPKTQRSIIRSKTFIGIAKAMAEQWGKYLE